MKTENSTKEKSVGTNSPAGPNPRSSSKELEVSKYVTFGIKALKPRESVNYFQAAVSKLVDSEETDSLSDEEWFLLFESTETLRREKNVHFIEKNYEKCKFLWLLFVVEQTSPFRAKLYCEKEGLDPLWNKFVLSPNQRNSTLGRISFKDILYFKNRLIKRAILEQRFMGVGYKDKGCMVNVAEDGSPSWKEVSSDWRNTLSEKSPDSLWSKTGSEEVFDWSIKNVINMKF